MNTAPSWDLYRSFLAILTEGSLSSAARHLGLTQPTVARHLSLLETAVGADLFLRTQRGLMPTEMALGLKPYAETLASTAAALLRTASAAASEVSGSVRVSASEVVSVEHLPDILAAVLRRHPGLIIELVSSDALDDLLRRDADIAVRMVEPAQDALVARHLPSIEIGLYAHRSYLERRGMPHTLGDLAGHDLVGFDHETALTRAFVRRFPQFERPSLALRSDSNLVQLAAVRAGLGIGPCQAVIAKRNPAMMRVLADAVAVELGVWIVMHEDLKTSPRCRAVFDALVDGLSALPVPRPYPNIGLGKPGGSMEDFLADRPNAAGRTSQPRRV